MHARTSRMTVAATLAVVISVIFCSAGAGTAVAAAETDPAPTRTIDVFGTGAVRGTPDVLDLVLGIEVRAKGAAEALTRNSTLLRKVLGILHDAGVDDDDAQTANLSIGPVTNEDGTAVIGYSVSNALQVTIRDLGAAGKIVDAATAAADEEIVVRGLSFSFDDNSQLVARARAEAVRRAKEQAEQLAKAAGVTLGRLLSIQESSSPLGPVITAETTLTADAAAPIQPGSERLSVDVSLRYEIA